MTRWSAHFGAATAVLATLLSQLGPCIPSGPLIVLAATLVCLVSLFSILAPVSMEPLTPLPEWALKGQ